MTQNSDFLSIDRRLLLGAMGTAVVAAAGLIPQSAQAAPQKPWTSEGFVERAGGRIHWVGLGEGPGEPLVLMHKLGGWIADWRDMAPLITGRRVIALDMPGHGQSTMTNKPPYAQSLPESAAMIKAALEEIGVSRCDLAGVSLGGCVSVVMAAYFPEMVGKLALMSVALNHKTTREDLLKSDAQKSDEFDAQGLPTPRTPEQVAGFGTTNPQVNIEQNQSRAQAGLWVRPSERGVGLAGVADYLPRISCPTLLVYADRGSYLKFETVGRAGLKDVRVEKIGDSGSFVQQDQPAKTAAVLNVFLNG